MSVLVIGRGAQVVASVVHALHDLAFEAVGVTEDDEATARLRAGGITALVIGGGVNRRARHALQRAARTAEVPVIHGALGGRHVADYVRDELAPRLRRS
jgi:hypothetical protein